MPHFWHNGVADLATGLVGLVVFLIIGLILARRIRRGKVVIIERAQFEGPQFEVAQDIFCSAAAHKPFNVWLRRPRSDIRYRLTMSAGCYVVERTGELTWPPAPGSTVRVRAIVIRPDRRFVTRYEVDVVAGPQGEIPVALTLTDRRDPVVTGSLYLQVRVTLGEITNLTLYFDEAQQE